MLDFDPRKCARPAFVDSGGGRRRRSAPTRRLVSTLEDHHPGLAVATLDHLGDIAERFPVALLELDAGQVVAQCREAALDRGEARVLLARVRNVEVHVQIVVGVVGLDRAPQLLVVVGADLDDLAALPRLDAQRLHGLATHHRGCELVLGPPAAHVHEHGERLLLVAGDLDGLHEGLHHVILLEGSSFMRRAISVLYAFRTSDQKLSKYRRSSSRPSRRTEYRRRLPRGSTRTRLASSSTFRCCDTAGRLTGSSAANSVTVLGRLRNASRMWRLVGSARAVSTSA